MPVGIVNLMTMTHDALVVGQGEEDFLRSLPGASGGWKRVQMRAVTDLTSPLPNNTFLFSIPVHFCIHVCQEKLLKGTRHFKPPANSSSSCYTLFAKLQLNCDNRYSLSEDLFKVNLLFTIILKNRDGTMDRTYGTFI